MPRCRRLGHLGLALVGASCPRTQPAGGLLHNPLQAVDVLLHLSQPPLCLFLPLTSILQQHLKDLLDVHCFGPSCLHCSTSPCCLFGHLKTALVPSPQTRIGHTTWISAVNCNARSYVWHQMWGLLLVTLCQVRLGGRSTISSSSHAN